MTLDAAKMDLSKAFVPGMGYVALSRVRSLEGLELLGINREALRVYTLMFWSKTRNFSKILKKRNSRWKELPSETKKQKQLAFTNVTFSGKKRRHFLVRKKLVMRGCLYRCIRIE
jgi:hypothetical protein